ncbi:MAG: hypothetical protein J6W75_00820 [Bacteroidaceae bacterium]|nr:hypothetical protein [Bacteroidaceae bacterium]
MGTNKQQPLLDTLHTLAQATQTHQQLAADCQRLQETERARFCRALMHGATWHINSQPFRVGALELWVSSNIEFSKPTLTLDITLRPANDEDDFSRIRLETAIPLTQMDPLHPLPTELDLPCTLPLTNPVTLYLHRRAGNWKTYPEVNRSDLTRQTQ